MEEKKIRKIILLVSLVAIAVIMLIVDLNKMQNDIHIARKAVIKDEFKGITAMFKDYMLSENDGKLKCYNSDGSTRWNYNLNYKSPALIGNGDICMAFDKRGNSIEAFDDNGRKWEYKVNGSIINAKANDTGDTMILFNGADNKGRIIVLEKDGTVRFKDEFNSGVVLDGGIEKNSNNYFAVVQDVIGDGLMYQVFTYDVNGMQTDVNTIKGEVYVGARFVAGKIICCDTSNIYCFAKGSVKWKKEIDGTIKRIFNDKEYFLYEVEPKGVALDYKDTLNVIDAEGKEKLSKNLDSDVYFAKAYEKGILAVIDRNVDYIAYNGSTIWSYPLYDDVINATFNDENKGYVVMNNKALSMYIKH